MTTKNKKKPALRLKKQTLAKLDEAKLGKTAGGLWGTPPTASTVTVCGISGHPLCTTTGGNHNRLAITLK